MSLAHRRLVRRLVPAAVVLVSAASLQGCGGAAPQPGIAASVDDTEITLDEVDTMTDALCTFASDDELFPTPPEVTRSGQRADIVETLINRVGLEDLLAERDVELPEDYDTQVKDSQAQFLGPYADEDGQVAAYVEAKVYTAAAAYRLGEDSFADEGSTPGTDSLATQRGIDELAEWIADHDISINPITGLEVVDGEIVEGGDVSVSAEGEDAESEADSCIE